ncbi:thiamine pyrophosphate-binding protein [Georgenia sp. Z1491]|uniref:thiamine pyrophosphate-binding protein n=1 Tax=Georgenia sp. Z1491 TaxID=3416707 RepID=UPI003CF061B3
MRVAEAVGRTLVELGVEQAFGVVGSGNFHATNALTDHGGRFVASRHEAGAALMADAYARLTGRVAVVSLHQGCGLTNAMTALTESAKSGSPVVVIVGDTPPTARHTSNFWIDQAGALRALGIEVARVHSARTAVADTAAAHRLALEHGRTVVLNMPLDVQEEDVEWSPASVPAAVPVHVPAPDPAGADEIARLLASADRPVIVAGRGARHARAELERLAEASGALLATSAVARGLFAGNPWALDVMGGFSSPGVADLIAGADLIVGLGVALNRWTCRNGDLVANARLVHVDRDAAAIGKHRSVHLGVVGDAALTATAVTDRLSTWARGSSARGPEAGSAPASPAGTSNGFAAGSAPGGAAPREGYRSARVRALLDSGVLWPDVPYEDTSGDGRIDPRTLTLALERVIPAERVVVTDAGNFTGYPANFLSVPDARGMILPLAFQSIGLSLGIGVGAAVTRPDRQVVVAVGDGGFMMSLVELDTAVRERLPLMVVVYNDSAYGAEIHHFDAGDDMTTVTFPETDVAAIARGFGCEGVTVREVGDVEQVRAWLDGDRSRPLVVDAKTTVLRSWVEEHVFQGDA